MRATIVELIAKKRDGARLEGDEIRAFLGAFMGGEVTDYQMAAFLMAVFFRGLDEVETVALTEAMLRSGRELSLPSVTRFKVDKHSTGGVGDKISLCLAPLVAACGLAVPMVSGRGLGHTGGTLDKLEAIPGFRVHEDAEKFERIVRDVGVCMIGQTDDIAPADKRIYALRDVTATVECLPLIVASILSKKLAEGIDGLVLDVKTGRGAFMKTEAAARALGEALVRVGTRAGKRVVAVLTDMDAPLGAAIGNANETAEAFDVLRGGGPPDVVSCTRVLGAEMLMLGGMASSVEDGCAQIDRAIASGEGLRVMERMVEAQGGDPSVVADPSRLEIAKEEVIISATRAGYVTDVDPLELGLAAVAMGAGRTRADQRVDHAVGIRLRARRGDFVRTGERLATLHVRNASDAADIVPRVAAAFSLSDEAPASRPLVIGRIER